MPTQASESVEALESFAGRHADVHCEIEVNDLQIMCDTIFFCGVPEVDEVESVQMIKERQDENAAAAEPAAAVVEHGDAWSISVVQPMPADGPMPWLVDCIADGDEVLTEQESQVRREDRQRKTSGIHHQEDSSVEEHACEEHRSFERYSRQPRREFVCDDAWNKEQKPAGMKEQRRVGRSRGKGGNHVRKSSWES